MKKGLESSGGDFLRAGDTQRLWWQPTVGTFVTHVRCSVAVQELLQAVAPAMVRLAAQYIYTAQLQ